MILIYIIAFILRIYSLDVLPPSLTWDEAAWGYNAYSLGVDGRDEFGRFLPLTYLESFGDYKPPLYAYLSILPVKIFGLNEFSTRLASAIFGVLTVIVTYHLTKQIFPNSRIILGNLNLEIAHLSSFILAISPWHILLSRAAFEANVATFFLALGVFCFISSLEKKRWLMILSAFSFVLSMYTFNTARIVAPLLVLGLIIGSRKAVEFRNKWTITTGIIGFVLFFPLFNFLLTPQSKLRYHEVNIFSDIKVIERVNRQIEVDGNTWWSKIIHNRRLAFGVEYLRHYLDNLSPNFLFIKGDGNPKFSTQDVGQMYLWELPFFVAGIFLLFKRRDGYWWIIPYWLIIAIIPAAAARETPHALRIEASLPTFQILSAFGLYYFINYIKKLQKTIARVKVYNIILIILCLIGSFNALYFFHIYTNHYAKEFSHEWQYGYKEAIDYIKQVEKDYDFIYFTESLGRPYIYSVFYLQTRPEIFRRTAIVEREVLGFVHIKSFGKFQFENDLAQYWGRKRGALFIDKPGKVPKGGIFQRVFKNLDGTDSLIAYSFN